MDEQSIWKKEISFRRRKPAAKPPVRESGPVEGVRGNREVPPSSADDSRVAASRTSDGDSPVAAPRSSAETPPAEATSIWKKEISFRRKPKERTAPPAPGEEPTSIWKKEISFKGRKEPGPDSGLEEGDGGSPEVQPANAESSPAEKQSIWKKEISLSRKRTPGPESGPGELPIPAAEPAAPEPAPQESVWQRETPEALEPEAPTVVGKAEIPAEPVERPQTFWRREPEDAVAAPVESHEPAGEAKTQESIWQRGSETAPAPEPVADEPLEEPLEEPHEEPVSAAEADLGLPEPDVLPVAPVAEVEVLLPEPEPVAEPPVYEPARAAVESWTAPPVVPPAPVETEPIPTVVHPPVPASELPPVEAPEKPVPFWKKEIVIGSRKPAAQPPVRDSGPVTGEGDNRVAPPANADEQPETKKKKKSKQPKAKTPKAAKAPRVKRERGSNKAGAKRLVGLKVGASQLAAARVSNNGAAELQQVAREPLDAGIVVGGELRDPDALSEALKEFFAKHKLPKKGVRLGIANNRIGVRTFEIAGIEDSKQLANAIRFRAQEALPIPIEDAVLDYQVLGEGTDEEGQTTRRILLVVAYRELIDRYVEACRKAGVTLVGIDLEAFALLRALQAPQAGVGDDPTAALVAVAIGHDRATFAVSDGRICEFTRVLDWGGSALNVAIARTLDRAPSEVEGLKRALSLIEDSVPENTSAEEAAKARDAVRKAIQTFARELVSSLQYYQNQPGSHGIGEIVLTGGTAHLPGLAAELERLIGVRVRVGDPLARMKVSKRVGHPDQIGSLAVAIGLGIED